MSSSEGAGGARGRLRTPSWAPNENVTVIKSRPVQYLLMKLRDVTTVGRVSFRTLRYFGEILIRENKRRRFTSSLLKDTE